MLKQRLLRSLVILVALGGFSFTQAQDFSVGWRTGFSGLAAFDVEYIVGYGCGVRLIAELPIIIGGFFLGADGVCHFSTDDAGSNAYIILGAGTYFTALPSNPFYPVVRLGGGYEWRLDPNVGLFIEWIPRIAIGTGYASPPNPPNQGLPRFIIFSCDATCQVLIALAYVLQNFSLGLNVHF
jgi:hypothetical protein